MKACLFNAVQRFGDGENSLQKKGEAMGENILGAVITFALGCVIATLNYLLSKSILKKNPEKYAMATIIRQSLQILYLAGVFLVSRAVSWNTLYMLIGAVLGITLPMFYFTHKLLQLNQKLNTNNNEKDGEDNG